MNELIVVSPTLERAKYYWRTFSAKYSPVIKKTNGRNLSVELLNGIKIYFASETQAPMVLKGFHGKVTYIDEFEALINRR